MADTKILTESKILTNNHEIKIDDEFKTLIPPLTSDEFEQLEQNIIAEGCREPLIIWDGFIVDGHNRYEICNKHGIKFETVEKIFESKSHAKEWIIRNQFGRRNLIPFQRAELALTLKDVITARARENLHKSGGDKKSENAKSGCQNSDNPIEPIDTKKELAKIAGVSHDTIWKVGKIQEKATPEEKEALQKGNVSVHRVFNDIREREGNPIKSKKSEDGNNGDNNKKPITRNDIYLVHKYAEAVQKYPDLATYPQRRAIEMAKERDKQNQKGDDGGDNELEIINLIDQLIEPFEKERGKIEHLVNSIGKISSTNRPIIEQSIQVINDTIDLLKKIIKEDN